MTPQEEAQTETVRKRKKKNRSDSHFTGKTFWYKKCPNPIYPVDLENTVHTKSQHNIMVWSLEYRYEMIIHRPF